MPLGGGRGSVGDSSLFFSCYHSLPFLTFFYRDFCAIPNPKGLLNLHWLFLQQLKEVLAELGHLRRDHCLTIRLVRVSREIFLVIILGHIELIEFCHFGDDGL